MTDQKVVVPQQAGETNQRRSLKFQQQEMQVLQLWRNKPMYRTGWSEPTGKQLSRKGPGGSSGHQADQEPAMCPCSKEGQQPPGLAALGRVLLASQGR